ncbi:hypothetical protein [Actinoplanes derwentensis]|uniref:hypothetical protein n=1 Tax=Actinoplanes derwentensis TaxID=113562 RepID=UPI000A7A7C63|nr:hypothetical protein [Actinoplanes derwentensis]
MTTTYPAVDPREPVVKVAQGQGRILYPPKPPEETTETPLDAATAEALPQIEAPSHAEPPAEASAEPPAAELPVGPLAGEAPVASPAGEWGEAFPES